MILKFGTYAHADGEITFSCYRQAMLKRDGQPYAQVERWDIRGALLPDDGASDLVDNLTTKIAALKAAYQQTGVDAVLYKSDGTTETAHKLLDSQTIGGIRVIAPPYFPQGEGAEYATYRTYALSIEADLPIGDGQFVVDFQETISVSGGGPEFAWTRPLYGSPVRKVVRQQTPFVCVQSGFATSYLSEPVASTPIYPQLMMDPGQVSTTRNGDRRTVTTTWAYTMMGTSQIIGQGLTGLYRVPVDFSFFAPRP